MNRKEKFRVILCFGLILFGLFLFLGCGTDSSGSNKKDPNNVNDNLDQENDAPVSFQGEYEIYETWEGCHNSGGENHGIIEIHQEGNTATLDMGSSSIDCQVMGSELHCSGESQTENGGIYDTSSMIFWFDENDNLAGESTWTFYYEDQAPCPGTSTFSSYPPGGTDEELPELSFDGSWVITETWMACVEEPLSTLYRADITVNGASANLTIGNTGTSLDCSLVGGELNCQGDRTLYDDEGEPVGHDELSAFTLRFDGEYHLVGDADWTYFDLDNNYCEGASELSAVPADGGCVLEIVNNTQETFEVVNIATAGGSFDADDWGANLLQNGDVLSPNESVQFSGIPVGIYNFMACPDRQNPGSGCTGRLGIILYQEGCFVSEPLDIADSSLQLKGLVQSSARR